MVKSYGFAKYLHDSLPNATYMGFTRTPIDATLDVFGPVVNAYTITESVKDKITIRIAYEDRAAKVILNNSELEKIEQYYKEAATAGANEYQIEESKKSSAKMGTILAVWSIVFKPTKGNAPDAVQMNVRVREMVSEGVEKLFKMDEGNDKQQDIFDPAYLDKIARIKLRNTEIKLLAKVIDAFKKANREQTGRHRSGAEGGLDYLIGRERLSTRGSG